MKKTTKTAVIYARVSTARQADDGLPVESQIDNCRAKVEELGAMLVQVFRDEGISGRTTQRPGFLAALDFCDERRIDYFVCWSSSRFARNHIDAALNKRVLAKSGTKLVFVSQDFGESDESWMIESIVAIMDEQYSRSIAKDTRRSMAKNAMDGFWNGGSVPFGYQAVPMGKRKRLAPVASEAMVVKTIYRWCLEGLGQKEIALRLNEAGTARRGKRWDKSSVASILRSRAVIGKIVFSDRGTEIVTEAHEGIIDVEVWELAQAKISDRAPRNAGGRPRSEAVFSGMLFCEKCGEAMYTESATGRAGVRYHYYNCRSFLKGFGCESNRMGVDWLDGQLLTGIAQRIFTGDNIRGILHDIKQQSGTWALEKQGMIDRAAEELADVERRLSRLYETIEAGAGLNLADVGPRIRELRSRQDALRVQIETLDADQGPQVTIGEAEADGAARIFRDVLVTAENTAKVRDFLGNVIKQITVTDGAAMIDYLPDRIVNTVFGDSQCVVRWLPERATLRTAKARIVLQNHSKKAA